MFLNEGTKLDVSAVGTTEEQGSNDEKQTIQSLDSLPSSPLFIL